MTVISNASAKKYTKIIVPLLISVAIIFHVLAFVFALNWKQQPFLGVLFYPRLVVSDTHNPDWNARQLGLQTADILLGIDGVPVSSGRDAFALLRQKQINDMVTLTLERDPSLSVDAPEVIPVSLSPFSSQDFSTFFWLPYVIGLVYLVLGIIVYRLRGVERVGEVFAAFCVFVSIFSSGLFDYYSLHLLISVWAFAFPLTGAGLLHLTLVFPEETRLFRRRPWLGLIPYVPALILGAVNLYSFYFASNPRTYLSVRLWGFGFLGLSVFLFLVLLLYARTSTLSVLVRRQTAIIFGGSIISFGPIAIWAAGNLLGFNWLLSWPIFIVAFAPLIIFPIFIAYATLRYRLLDLDIVFSRGVTYALLMLLVTVVYFLIVSALGILLHDTTLFQNPIILAIFILALVVFLEPMRHRLQTIVNRLFLREPFDSRQVLQNYGRTLISTPLYTDHILELLLKQADEALTPEHTLVFLRDRTLSAFAVRHQHRSDSTEVVEVRFGLNDDLAEWLANTNNILQLSPSGATPPNVNIAREELARLRMLDVTLCVPLLGSEYLLGWLALGLKKSGQPYTSNDLMFLTTLASQTAIALENAHLLEQANRRAAELEALQKISVDIQAEVEPDLLLTSVVQQATKLLRVAGGMVYLLAPDNKTLKVVVSYNLDKDYTGYTVEIGEGVAGQVLMWGEPVVVDNYHNFPGRSHKFEAVKFGAVMGVPLRWRGRVQGVLYLVHHPRNLRFSQDDVWLMELFATQAAIALEKSGLLQEAQRQAEQLATLSEVSMAIGSTLELDTTLQQVMSRAVQILHAEAGSLLLMDARGEQLTFEVVLGPTGSELLGMKNPVGTGIVGTVAQTGQPLIINDAAADPRWNVAFDEATDFHTKDILCVPMIAYEQVVGVIEVINKQDGTVFTEEEAGLLISFGAQAAIAIKNAQIFSSTDRALAGRVQELQTIQMFVQELQTSLNLATVLDLSLSRIMDTLGLSMGLIGIIRNQSEESGLYLLAQRGMPMEMGRYKIDPWPLTKGIMGRVAHTGELAWVNDITQEKNYVPKSHRTRSLLVVPVLREGRVIGVIDLESTDPDYFTSDDVAFVKLLVSHAAIAIENAQLFDQVREANQAKTEFMNTASHELKIPMTSIKGYAKLLEMGAGGSLTDQQANFLNVISNNTDRMAQLVNDLLDVSRIEAGRIRLEIQDVQMRDVINEVIESVQNQIKNKQLNLTVDIADNLPELRADYNRMVQIVTNLVSNAYKYTPEGGDIAVIAKPYNGDIEGISVTVKDTGYGISEEDQAKLFTTFFRSGDQNVRNEPGTGLGLSITKKMVETHGGELTLESELGKGSAFTFTMPLISKIPPGVEVVER